MSTSNEDDGMELETESGGRSAACGMYYVPLRLHAQGRNTTPASSLCKESLIRPLLLNDIFMKTLPAAGVCQRTTDMLSGADDESLN